MKTISKKYKVNFLVSEKKVRIMDLEGETMYCRHLSIKVPCETYIEGRSCYMLTNGILNCIEDEDYEII